MRISDWSSDVCSSDLTPASEPAPWANDPSALRIEADVRKLAGDAMERRETGTRGYRLASAYVAERFADLGLQPAGDAGTFFQRVPLPKANTDREGPLFTVTRNGRSLELRFPDHFLPHPSRPRP